MLLIQCSNIFLLLPAIFIEFLGLKFRRNLNYSFFLLWQFKIIPKHSSVFPINFRSDRIIWVCIAIAIILNIFTFLIYVTTLPKTSLLTHFEVLSRISSYFNLRPSASCLQYATIIYVSLIIANFPGLTVRSQTIPDICDAPFNWPWIIIISKLTFCFSCW